MSEPFLSSDDYDERAHQLYNEAQYDEAIETLREGLGLYPPRRPSWHVGMDTRGLRGRNIVGAPGVRGMRSKHATPPRDRRT